MTMAVVQARKVRKVFGRQQVICDVDFEIQSGTCFGILGPNGAGKTTLMRMLLGASPVSAGEFLLFGQPVGAPSQRARLGVVPQMDNLDPDFSVRENLYVYAGYFGLSRRAVAARVEELLRFIELHQRGHAAVATLSGGMRRRLMIARSLINDPELVVLDEPTTGLDPQARHLIWQRLRQLKRSGKTLILTTHYMEEAAQLCDDLIILDRGRILARGTPEQLVKRNVEAEVVELRGELTNADVAELTRGLAVRSEHIGDTWFCYAEDAKPLLARCAGMGALSYLHRPANLEDVFLKLTGRDLHE